MQLIHRSHGEGVMVLLFFGVLVIAALLVSTGCVGNRRQRDYAKLYRVVQGEEREDFGRLASWIADRDGQITLPVGGSIHWAETAYYRWYSNETFVVMTCPPRFHESRSTIEWVCGSVKPVKRGVGWTMSGDYGLRGPGTYDFPGVIMRPETATQDGVFGIRFGDGRDRLLKLQDWHFSDQPENNKQGALALNGHPEYNCFVFNWLLGYPDIDVWSFLTHDKRVGILHVRMSNSPSLAGLDFMKEDPPVLRQDSFIVNDELAAKGRRLMQPQRGSSMSNGTTHSSEKN